MVSVAKVWEGKTSVYDRVQCNRLGAIRERFKSPAPKKMEHEHRKESDHMNRILGKLPIGLKLGGSFVIIVLILAASISLSYTDMSQLNGGMMSLYFDHTIPIQNLGEAKSQLGQIKSNIQLYIQIPRPQSALTGSKDAPRCGTCHISEVSGSHNLKTGQTVGDATRCLTCHSKQAGNLQHGQSATEIAAGHAAELDCAACHSADVINQQHTQVENSINDEIARVNEIISEYGKDPLLTAEEKTALATFDTSWKSYQNIVADLLAKFKSGKSQETLHRVVAGDALASQKEIEDAINNLVTINQKLASQSQEKSTQTFNGATLRLLIAGIAGIILAAGLGFLITFDIRTPVEAIAKGLQNLRQGHLNWDVPDQVKENISQRSDEIGIAGKGFESTVQYLKEMAGVANQIASGDLTVKVNTRNEKDELGIAFSQMITSLQNLIVMVTENANNLTTASAHLAKASGQSGEATRQIAITIQQVALGTAQQTASVTKTSGSVEQMGRAIDGVAKGAQEQARAITIASEVASRINTAIEQVTNNVHTVTRDSAQSASYSRDGAETIKDTISGMEVIRTKVGLSAAKVEEMGARSEKIGAIAETIEDIASQTNLLALNAAIEAARAGEHGKGFAVVADEVRKLAERSSLATKEIATLIKDIQKTVSEAVSAMKASAAEVESGVTRANSAGEALNNILGAVESVYKQAEDAGVAAAKVNAAATDLVEAVDTVSAVIEQNTAATEEMAANSSELTQSIENIASISEQNSAAVEEVSASTEEVSAQVEEVSASATSLMEMAQRLQQVVSRFKLETGKGE